MPSADDKEDFPPLLPVGRHPTELETLKQLCVDAFPASATRRPIMAGLLCVVRQLSRLGIIGELWVDGSFLTSKVDPEDVDVVLSLQSDFADRCNPEQTEAVLWVAGDLHDSHKCHSFVLVQWPEGHPRYWDGHYSYVYWMKQWGFDRAECRKGIAVVQLPQGKP